MVEETPKRPPGTSRRWKRRVILALLLLIGGAVVNVAVAWLFTSWVSMVVDPTDGSLDSSDRAWVVRNGGTYIRPSDVPNLAGLSETHNAGLSLTLVVITGGGAGFTPAAQVTRAGWPLKALLGGRVFPTGLNTAGGPDLLIDAVETRLVWYNAGVMAEFGRSWYLVDED